MLRDEQDIDKTNLQKLKGNDHIVSTLYPIPMLRNRKKLHPWQRTQKVFGLRQPFGVFCQTFN